VEGNAATATSSTCLQLATWHIGRWSAARGAWLGLGTECHYTAMQHAASQHAASYILYTLYVIYVIRRLYGGPQGGQRGGQRCKLQTICSCHIDKRQHRSTASAHQGPPSSKSKRWCVALRMFRPLTSVSSLNSEPPLLWAGSVRCLLALAARHPVPLSPFQPPSPPSPPPLHSAGVRPESGRQEISPRRLQLQRSVDVRTRHASVLQETRHRRRQQLSVGNAIVVHQQ
jgi:hypothetical protein